MIYQDQAIRNNDSYLYQIPIYYQTQLESLDIVLSCSAQDNQIQPQLLPTTNAILNNSAQYANRGNSEFIAEWHLTDVKPIADENQILSYVLPTTEKSVLTAVEVCPNEDAYFAVSCVLPKSIEQRMYNQNESSPRTICVLWDAGLNRSNSKENRLIELNALKGILNHWLINRNQLDIVIQPFRFQFDEPLLFQLRTTNWNEFLKIFEDLVYDGTTDLSLISTFKSSQKIDVFFLCSACMSTINQHSFNSTNHLQAPIWIFNGNHIHEPFNNDTIRYLTQYSPYGGGYFNREQLQANSNDLISVIQTIQIKYTNIYSNDIIQQIYPSQSIIIPLKTDRFLLVGRISLPLPEFVEFQLEFSLNNQTALVPIKLNNQKNFFGLIRRLWAQEKINELNMFKEKNKSDILSVGLEYSIVSQCTSLLVLETIQQHIKYDICPAQSRTALYNSYLQYQKQKQQKSNNSSQLLSNWIEKCDWFDGITKPKSQIAFFGNNQMPMSIRPSVSPFGSTTANTNLSFGLTTTNTNLPFGSTTVNTGFGPTTANTGFGPTTANTGFGPATTNTNLPFGPTTANTGFGPTTTNTNLLFGSTTANAGFGPITTNSPFGSATINSTLDSAAMILPFFSLSSDQSKPALISRLSSATNPSTAYSIYLSERENYRRSPSFYFDVASYFFSEKSFSSTIDQFNGNQTNTKSSTTKTESIEYGIRILTNILELEHEISQFYQIVAYKLIEIKEWNLALNIYRKIHFLNSSEIMPLYNLALILIELKRYDEAVVYFEKILTDQSYSNNSNTYRIVLSDYNRLIHQTKQTPINIDRQFLRHLPVDIRIVVQSNSSTRWIQLNVTQPNDQPSQTQFAFGTGTSTNMFTTNSIFEDNSATEYLIRRATNGTYSVSVTSTSGAAMVLVHMYKYFGTDLEEKQTKTLCLTRINETAHVGEITFTNINRIDTRQSKIQHVNCICDGCSQTPIIGNRYRCLFCPNIDLCQNCHDYPPITHDSQHPLICIRDSTLFNSSIYLQDMSAIKHDKIQCQTCSVSPIIGVRYQCVQCNIDICEKCEFRCLHDLSHQRLKIIFPIQN